MPKSYSVDLHWRDVWQHLVSWLSYAKIGELLFSLSSPYDIYTVQEHGHDYLLTEFEQMCCKVLLPSLTSTCLNHRVPLVYHSHWLGFTRKTLTTIAAQQGDELRDKFIAETPVFHLQMIVWVDEMGSDSQVAWLEFERNPSSEPCSWNWRKGQWLALILVNVMSLRMCLKICANN